MTVLKDQNIILNKEDRLMVKPELARSLLQRIEKDKEFLKSCSLMDYSLLIIFFKKQEIIETPVEDVQEAEDHKNMKLSVFIKKGTDGNFIQTKEYAPKNILPPKND
jgi:hypothetical protein